MPKGRAMAYNLYRQGGGDLKLAHKRRTTQGMPPTYQKKQRNPQRLET
jgi:hypothetical protein